MVDNFIDEAMFDDIVLPDLEETEELVDEPIVETVTDDNPPEGDELARVLYESYLERGYLTESEDNKFDGTFEWIEKSLDDLPDRIQETIVSSVPPVGKEVLDFILSSGTNLTKESLTDFVSKFLKQEETTVETLDDAREYLTKVYEKKGMKQRAIDAQLDDLEDSEELLTTAQRELANEKTETTKAIEKAKELTKEQRKQQEEFNSSVEQSIAALPKTRQPAVVQTAQNALSIINEIGKNPSAYVQFMDLLSYYKDGKFDLSVFEKQAESNSISKLKDKISASKIVSASKGKSSESILDKEEYELVV